MAKTKKDLAGKFKLKFFKKHIHRHGNDIATITDAYLQVNHEGKYLSVNSYDFDWIYGKGVAQTNIEAGDTFVPEVGEKMSAARSENDAYLKAKEILKGLQKEAESIMVSALAKQQLLDEYIAHNKEYIKKLA